MTRYAVLTPPGTGAIAVIAVSGPDAWPLVLRRFRPAGKPLPVTPTLHAVRLGTLGDGAGDEVVVAVTQVAPAVTVEVHCHGGPQVVRMLCELLDAEGCHRAEWYALARGDEFDAAVLPFLAAAPTVRNASILLDQYHGAFRDAVRSPGVDLERLRQLVPVGAHLVTPWDVVVVGPPNAGKSSLVNAIAGYQRSVVTPIAGTTRDAVRVEIAIDGVAVRLTDTAGLRDTVDSLEAEGVRRATALMASADLVVYVLDGTDPAPIPDGVALVVWNKADLVAAPADVLAVSATTGQGLRELMSRIVATLEPVQPLPGEAVPYGEYCAALGRPGDDIAASLARLFDTANPPTPGLSPTPRDTNLETSPPFRGLGLN